ncbi:hypothetical protein KUL156_03930 [Alteromonas sp. KUL156]|nr:hypothetical protein KUL154_28140 [Alteromonas sp. KUL154]GFD97800.1 hypothetical protein KUL156_03930 [Alteromonas sp. KUL156]
MHSHYHFVRRTRRFSLIVLANACLLPVIYWACENYLIKGQFEPIVLIAVAITECLLLGIAAYLWVINRQVEIRVTSDTFYYNDPLFGGKELTVSTDNIVELVQVQSATHRMLRNLIRLKDGSVHELMYQNYSINKQAMFDALKKANRNIKLPASIWDYEQSRPQWAKEVRKQMGLDE